VPRIRNLVIALIAAPLALAGCASDPGLAPRAEIVAEISCAGLDPLGGSGSDGAGLVPDGFEAVAAVRCVPFQTVEDEEGVWSVVVRERLEGDLTALLEAQAAPDDPGWPGPCAAIMTIAPQIWLTDAAGRGIRVRHPADGCGQPKVDLVADAVAKLDVVRTDEEERTLTEPRAALDAGCAPTWSARPLQLAPVDGLGDVEPAPDPAPTQDGVQTIPWAPPRTPAPGEVTALRLCTYSTEQAVAPMPTPAPGATGWATIHTDGTAWFTGGRELDADRTRAVLEAVASAQPMPGPCDEAPGSLVVLSAGEGTAPITVELDGCRRLVVDYLTTYAAPAHLIELLGE